MLESTGMPKTWHTLIAALVVVILATVIVTAPRAETATTAAEQLRQARAAYAKRHIASQDRLAASLYEKAIAADASYTALWEGARACSHLGQNAWAKQSRDKRRTLFAKGKSWAERATEKNPRGAEGFFYLAVLTGLDAREHSFMHQMASARSIRKIAERALKLDASVECGGPPRLLGHYYRKLPTAFGGDNRQALKYFEQALSHCPGDHELHYAIAECLHTLGEDARARPRAQWVLKNPPSAPSEQRNYLEIKQQTIDLLAEID